MNQSLLVKMLTVDSTSGAKAQNVEFFGTDLGMKVDLQDVTEPLMITVLS